MVLLSLICGGNELYRAAPVILMDLDPMLVFVFFIHCMYLLSISSKYVMNIFCTYIRQKNFWQVPMLMIMYKHDKC